MIQVISQGQLNNLARLRVEFVRDITETIERQGTVLLESIETSVQQNPQGFKHRTGRLASGFKKKIIRTSRGNLLRIENNEPHAKMLEDGVRPHTIRARNGRALRFMKNGRVFYRRQVRHPGIKPTRFLSQAAGRSFGTFSFRLTNNINNLARSFSRRRLF